MHENFCINNIVLCKICKEPIMKSEIDEHMEECEEENKAFEEKKKQEEEVEIEKETKIKENNSIPQSNLKFIFYFSN